MNSQTRRVAVLGGNRIPFARSNTAYSDASNQEMLTAAIDGLATRFGLEGERVGEVVAGAVLKAGVAIGLATVIVEVYPTRGAPIQTLFLATLAVNQTIGPILFRIALSRAGELATRTEASREVARVAQG